MYYFDEFLLYIIIHFEAEYFHLQLLPSVVVTNMIQSLSQIDPVLYNGWEDIFWFSTVSDTVTVKLDFPH